MRYRLPHRVVIQRGLLRTLTIIEMCRQVLNTNPSSVELYIYLGKIVTEIFKLIKPACLCHVCKLQLKQVVVGGLQLAKRYIYKLLYSSSVIYFQPYQRSKTVICCYCFSSRKHVCMCSSHRKVVKGVMQPRTWENGPFGRVCDLVYTQKDELSQSQHMGLTIYTKWNINLASYGQDFADAGAKGGKPGHMTCWPKCNVCVLEAR